MSIINSDFVREEVSLTAGNATRVKFIGRAKSTGMRMMCALWFTPEQLNDQHFIDRIKEAIEAEFLPN